MFVYYEPYHEINKVESIFPTYICTQRVRMSQGQGNCFHPFYLWDFPSWRNLVIVRSIAHFPSLPYTSTLSKKRNMTVQYVLYSTVWRNGGGWINCCKQTRFPINFNSFASRLLPGVLLAPGKKGNLRAGIIPPHLWRPIALTARSTAQYCTCTSACFTEKGGKGFSISLGRHRRRENGREEKPSSFNHLSLHSPWGRRAGQKKGCCGLYRRRENANHRAENTRDDFCTHFL